MAYQSEIELRVRVLDKELRKLEERIQKVTNPYDIGGRSKVAADKQRKERLQIEKEISDAQIAAAERLEKRRLKSFQTAMRRIAFQKRERLKQEREVARQRQKLNENLALGVGFPLLFGGGAGAVAGGALGAVAGSKLGDGGGFGLQILFSALGQQIDAFFSGVSEAATTVASSLDGTTETLDALGEAGIKVEQSLIDQVQSLEDAGRAVAAYDAVQKELTATYGERGLQALQTLKSANENAAKSTSELNAVLQAELAPTFTLIADVSGAAAIALARLVPILNALLNPFQGTPDPERARQAARQGRIDAGVRQRAAQIETSQTVGQLSGDVSSLERQTEIARLNNDLTNDRVVLLRQVEIITKATSQIDALEAETQANLLDTNLKQVNAAKIQKIEAQKNLDLAELEASTRKAVAAEAERTAAAQERAAKLAERAEKARMKELQDAIDIATRERDKELQLEASFQKQIDALGDQNALLRGRLRGEEDLVRKQIEINNLVKLFGEEKRGLIELLVNEKYQLTEQVDVLTQQQQLYAQIGQTIQSGLVQGIQDAITGSKSLGESLSGILKQVGGMFLQAGIGSFGVGGKEGSGLLGALFAADGAYVSGPTPAVVGEGGESEYIIPSSKMNEAMGRYARGARGGAVIPDGPGGDASGGMAGGGGSIDVSYSVERINNVNYVTAAQFERGMAQAAKRGAELGRQGVYSDLVNKRSVRSRVGV